MPKPLDIDLYAKHLFSDELTMTQDHVPVDTQRRLLRCRDLYAYWKRFPSMTSTEMVQHCVNNKGVSRQMAWTDIWLIKQLLGMFEKDTKAWHLYNFNKEIMSIYKKAIDNGDFKTAEKALADYAKFNKLDKDEETPSDWWQQIIPQGFKPTSDPTVTGIKPMPNLREDIKKWNKIFREDSIDASYEEVKEAAIESGELKREE